ncbi:hypothetical protein LTR51_008649 [Lithohypha guttulata]|nr:hypothetical protein LTR51_008649 [Lithohypha guttulata]
MDIATALNGTNSTEAFYEVKLSSSVFGKSHVMADMVVSGICVLSFLVFYVWRCCFQRKDEYTKKIFAKLLPGSIFLMILYFGLEFANTVLLIIGELRVIQYYPSLIALDFISLFADSSLLSFLLIMFAKRIYDHTGKDDSSILLYKGYCWIVTAIAVANIPAFFYQGFESIMSEGTQDALNKSGGIKIKILASYGALNISFYGVCIGGVFILAWITISHLRKLGEGIIRHSILKTCMPLLIVSLLARTIGKFIYAILFVLQARTKSPTMQLIHTIFYGLLSVLIYGSIMVTARSDSLCQIENNTDYIALSYTS